MNKILNGKILPKNQSCPHCGRFDNRGTTVDAVVIKNDQILLIKRGVEPDKGKWALVGGYVDWDESVDDAVGREVSEETGLHVKSLKFIGQYSDPKRHPRQTIDSAYLVEVEGKVKAGDDAVDFQWFDINNIPPGLAFDHNQIIKDCLKIIVLENI